MTISEGNSDDAEQDGRASRASGRRDGRWPLSGRSRWRIVAFTTPWRELPAGAPVVTPDPARDFPLEQITRAETFDALVSVPAYLSLGLTLIFAGVLVSTPLGARLLGRLRGPWWLRVLLGVLGLSVAVEILRWPLGMWSETDLRDFGLSTQTWATWTADRIKNIGVNTGLTAIMVLAVVALARRFRRWWIPAAIGAFVLTLLASFAYPVVIEPIFNDFRPMASGQLRDDLLAMASRDGVPVEDVLVADASRRTTALNAYVSGFGATRRIVVYDTLLQAPADRGRAGGRARAGPRQGGRRAVRHAHRRPGRGVRGVPALPGDLGGGRTAVHRDLLARRSEGGGTAHGTADLATVLSGPAQNLISRHIEARADVHALNLTNDPATFISMQKRWRPPTSRICRPTPSNTFSTPRIPRPRSASPWRAPGPC